MDIVESMNSKQLLFNNAFQNVSCCRDIRGQTYQFYYVKIDVVTINIIVSSIIDNNMLMILKII